MSSSFSTKVIHSSYIPEEHNRALMPPIYQNSMFKMNGIGEDIPYRYSRISNPTRDVLEKTMADLEGGCQGLAYSSGIAAIDGIFRALLKPGDTVIATADLYGGTYDLLTQVYAPWGVKVIFADLTHAEKLKSLLEAHPHTKLLWLESPSNPLLKISDLERLAAIAHEKNVLAGADNTFATPYLQQPLALGLDFAVHSATKYLCGHSDVLMGISVVKDPKYAEIIKNIQINTGAVAAPMDCFLVLRGLKTLALRMDRHQDNAADLAAKLSKHPAVAAVYYPGLANHPGRHLAAAQMQGYGGVVSIRLQKDNRMAADTVIKNLKLFQMSSSLGGVESLINHSASQSHSGMSLELKEKLGISEGLLRLSVGIEDVADLWQDLNTALTSIA